ncbi:uncharacterized protein E0L32_005945 [Thyridium curvatum]|uniref:Enoyl-CoA hydratase domain-containing protein 3, mitochondrial n=1 Tax=Thyridium curvatum TaxID=1093900 RepID=A0A507AUV7_9PEZI|nr:uncharacterized protein E0L32_005945 [Thyridium curvatum]TPX13742.1 hypothetical protein E0L32_005945 [Thyridium curvatum]
MTPLPFPRLPPKAAYIFLNNPSKRNALSLAVLRDLRAQLHAHLSPPQSPGRPLLLPAFRPSLLPALEAASRDPAAEHAWLLHSSAWRALRAGLPTVLVLRSAPGPVFSSGHDLRELSGLSGDEVRETFRLCAEVMTLLRRSPAPVVCAVQGLATAAGCQLALSADVTVAPRGTPFALPGMSIGLPCTSPSTAVSRRASSPALAYRMFATAEGVRAEDLGGAVDVVDGGEEALEERVAQLVAGLAGTSGQAQAFGKWAFWTQMGIRGGDLAGLEGEGMVGGGDGYEEAVSWAGRVMALHAKVDDAREGMEAFLGKRKPEWKT